MLRGEVASVRDESSSSLGREAALSAELSASKSERAAEAETVSMMRGEVASVRDELSVS